MLLPLPHLPKPMLGGVGVAGVMLRSRELL